MSYKDLKGNVVLRNESGTVDPRLTTPAPKPMPQSDAPMMAYDSRRAKRTMSGRSTTRPITRSRGR